MIDPHNMKHGIVSYETIYQILDKIDVINELNSNIDQSIGNVPEQVDSILENISEVLKKVEELQTYWQNVKRAEYKKE